MQDLIRQIKEARSTAGRVEDVNARLGRSSRKVDAALSEYGAAPSVARVRFELLSV